uniref:3-oxoacid CoA-transferase subunit B n=1 Tax=Phenylobacterium sp. TaxID=1871053 RepID=UPI00374DCF43
MLVNLGLGIPILASDYVPDGRDVFIQSENGIIGCGPLAADNAADTDLVDAGSRRITLRSGASIVHSADSFAMIRGGHIDLSVLGAMQVAENGDLANWMVPGKMVKGMGGAMDLVAGVKRVVVVMEHTEKSGASKLVKACTLPLTGRAVVDVVITELGVFDVSRGKSPLTLLELAPGVTVDEVRAKTEADFAVAPGLA